MKKRRRGTAILETKGGILITSTKSKKQFLLPGGGADRKESRFRAAIRELEEETGLLANYAKVIFRYESKSTLHTVVLVEAKGELKPKQEVKYLDYFKPGKEIPLSNGTKEIIKKYYKWKSKNAKK